MTQKRLNIFLMMATLLTGSFITTLAETLMNNGLPMIMKETHVSQMSSQWLNTGYMLVAGMVMPLTHFFMKRYPLKRLFTATMVVFLAGTLVATFAPDFNKDIPDNVVAVGNPCHILRKITDADKPYYFKKRKFDDTAWKTIQNERR